MTANAPAQWQSVANQRPMIHDLTSWQPIREWALSSVYRVVLPTGQTAIAKRSTGAVKGELAIYASVLDPLAIEHPQIYSGLETDTDCFMVMEDLGSQTLEAHPSRTHFLAAARKLAQIHTRAEQGIGQGRIDERILRQRTRFPQEFIDDAELLLRRIELTDANRSLMNGILRVLPRQLETLYRASPITLVHSDYYTKNLIVRGDDICVIDWTNAYFSPHLGDLHGLAREAINEGVEAQELYSAYIDVAANRLGDDRAVMWRVFLGAVCWSVQSIRWVLTDGVRFIPGSEGWIPDMFNDLQGAVERLLQHEI